MKLKSRRALLEFMEFQKLSGRALAKKAGISPALIGHLARDPKRYKNARDTCSLKTARAIEEALGCPQGFLFATAPSTTATNKNQPDEKKAA